MMVQTYNAGHLKSQKKKKKKKNGLIENCNHHQVSYIPCV
jgi:hypothetical protein